MKRWIFVALISLAMSTGCRTAAPASASVKVADDLQIIELRPGVWMHTSWRKLADGNPFPSNGLIIREGKHLLLVDTAWGEPATRELLEWIDSNLRLPIAAAVITHWHDDRLGGASLLAERGISFYASPMTCRVAADQHLPVPSPLEQLREPGDRQRFGMLETFFPGPAHTRDNIMVWLPREHLLFGGCAIRAASTDSAGNIADADLASWPESIRRAARRYRRAEIVVPGHGDPGDAALLQHTIDVISKSR